ncbi:RNA-directed DNA polymerase from mobile element jockey [Eumeta japonica]|uniref:RNA-directed DNA polymerase from mobile element jockey n=1 Tax=Eumeta variegata TaxID=151549 RepID=A0A4C1ZVI9_EUMVA|nr:RNA-directed DNA polymerase from mobile element jockey [Eumeta japonica]
MISVYPLTTPLDPRLSRESFKFGPLKWGHHHWTVGVVSPTRRRPDMRQHKSSVPHLHPQKKGCGRSANERSRHNAAAHKSTAPPRIRKGLRKIYGGGTLGYEKGIRQVSALLSTTSYPPHADTSRSTAGQLRIELYALYTGDIPLLRGHRENWEDDVMLALYSDDSAHFASSRKADLAAKRIQRVFDLLPELLNTWRMAVNVSKTAALSTGSQRILLDQLRLRGQAVEWKTCVRYLGRSLRLVHIDRSLRMVPQVNYVIQMSRAARAKLRPILASKLSIKIKLAIYKYYIHFRLTYVAPSLYTLCTELQRQRLQALQNIVLHMIAGAGWYVKNDMIARDLKVETLEDFVKMLARRAFNRADAGPYTSLHNLAPQ